MPRNVVTDRPAVALEDLISTAQHCCVALGNVVLTRSLCAPDPAFLRDWTNAVLNHAKAHPQGLGLIIIIDENAPPPTEAERTPIKNAYVATQSVVRGVVQIVEGAGFMAAAKRGAMAVINLATGIGVPIKVAGNIAEGTPLLRKLLGPAMDTRLDAAALTRASDSLRARLSP